MVVTATNKISERAICAKVSPVFSVSKWISVVLETFIGIFAQSLVHYSF